MRSIEGINLIDRGRTETVDCAPTKPAIIRPRFRHTDSGTRRSKRSSWRHHRVAGIEITVSASSRIAISALVSTGAVACCCSRIFWWGTRSIRRLTSIRGPWLWTSWAVGRPTARICAGTQRHTVHALPHLPHLQLPHPLLEISNVLPTFTDLGVEPLLQRWVVSRLPHRVGAIDELLFAFNFAVHIVDELLIGHDRRADRG